MSAMSNEDYADAVLRMGQQASAFSPMATYIPEGDCIEFIISPDDYYAQRIDGLVTVYYSRKTKQLAGSLIKGVQRFCQEILSKYPGFKIELESGCVKLEHIFLAHLWQEARETMIVRTYRELIHAAEQGDVHVEMTACA